MIKKKILEHYRAYVLEKKKKNVRNKKIIKINNLKFRLENLLQSKRNPSETSFSTMKNQKLVRRV